MERQLLGSYSTYAFKQHTRLLPETFKYLCDVLAPSLIRADLHMRLAIHVRTQVALSLNRLCSGNSLRWCAETYGIHESTASIIVREFCKAIDKHLKPLVIVATLASSP
jgi:hypothetical protein